MPEGLLRDEAIEHGDLVAELRQHLRAVRMEQLAGLGIEGAQHERQHFLKLMETKTFVSVWSVANIVCDHEEQHEVPHPGPFTNGLQVSACTV